MKRAYSIALVGILLASTAVPSQAQGLVESIIGDDGLVSIGSGEADGGGLVDVGIGSGGTDSGNVLDVDIGNSSDPLASVEVGSGGSSGSALGVGVDVGDNLANGDISVGGSDGLVDADVDLLNDNVRLDANIGGDSLLDVGVGIGGGNGGPGTPGGPGSPGGPGGPGGPGNNSGNNVASNGGGSGGASAACSGGTSVSQIARLMRSTRVDASWQRASNVEVQRVQVCPEVTAMIRSELRGSGMGQTLQSAVSADALISTSLSRTSYDASDVFAVRRSGSQLTVFVY